MRIASIERIRQVVKDPGDNRFAAQPTFFPIIRSRDLVNRRGVSEAIVQGRMPHASPEVLGSTGRFFN